MYQPGPCLSQNTGDAWCAVLSQAPAPLAPAPSFSSFFVIKEILKAAHKIYDQDFASKSRADTIRTSLVILDTYK